MKKFFRRFKRFLAAMLASVVLCNTVFCDALTVHATEAVAAYSLLESLLLVLGIDIGLGYQPDFVSQSYDDFSDLISSWKNKDKVTVGGYGTVDFSDSDSIAAYLEWAHSAVNSSSVLEDGYDNDVYNALKALDEASYSNTGSSASNGLRDVISSYYGDYNGSSEAFAEDVDSVFTVINGGGLNNDDDNDDDDKNVKWYQKALTLLGLFGIGIISHGDAFDSLSVADESEFTDYDVASSYSDYFYSDSFDFVFDSYVDYSFLDSYSYSIKGSGLFNFYTYTYKSSSEVGAGFFLVSNKPFSVWYNKYSVYSSVSSYGDIYYYKNGICTGSPKSHDDVSPHINHHVFNGYYSDSYMLESFNITFDDSGSYSKFLNNVDGASKFFNENGLYDYLGKVKPGDDLSSIISPLADAATAANGTSTALNDVADAIAQNNPSSGDSSVDDSDTGSETSLLVKILNAIKALPKSIWDFFMDPITAIRDSVNKIPPLIQSIIDLLANLPDSLQSLVDGLLNIQDVLLPVIQTLPDWYRGFALGLDEIPDTLTSIWTELSQQLKDFKEAVVPDDDPYIPFISQILDRLQSIDDAINAEPDSSKDTDTDSTEPIAPDDNSEVGSEGDGSGFSLGLLNGLLLLIYILFMLLRIFLHLLEFIINIFKIGADPGFITGDFATGFNFIKSVELEGMGVSVYDFFMILVHIGVIFAVVKVLRRRIEKLNFS